MAGNGAGLRWATVLVIILALAVGLLWFVRTQNVMLVFMGVWAATVVLTVLAAAHVLLREDLSGTQRLVWLLIVVFVNPGLPVGSGAYLLMGPERTRALFADVRVGGGAPPSAE